MQEGVEASEKQRIHEGKVVEFYAANVNAWVNSRLEHDKSLLTLSTAGLGVLVTLMPTAVKTAEGFSIYCLALISFLICIFAVLWALRRNKKYLEDVVNEREKEDVLLRSLDLISSSSFLSGVFFASLIGIFAAIRQF